MADASRTDDTPSEEKAGKAKPTLVAVGDEAKQKGPESPVTAPAPPQPAEQKRGSRLGLLLLLLVAVAAGVAALVQTQRLQDANARAGALSEQVIGLEAQLSVANTQIATYEMQRGRVREAVSDLSERVLLLGELVAGDGTPPPPR